MDKVKYCEAQRDKYNMNPKIKFEDMTEEELNRWIQFFEDVDHLWKERGTKK